MSSSRARKVPFSFCIHIVSFRTCHTLYKQIYCQVKNAEYTWSGLGALASLRNAAFRGSSIPRAERRKSGFVEEMQVSRAHTQSLQEAI